MRRLVALTLFYSNALLSQSRSDWPSCPVMARMPADMDLDRPPDKRQRFEIRECGDSDVIVTGYERARQNPSLIFDTGDGYPRFLSQTRNVLVFQSLGGASDHVYVFMFKAGKPSVVLRTATKDLIQVVQSEARLIVRVPPVTYPDENGKFPEPPAPKEYSFSIGR